MGQAVPFAGCNHHYEAPEDRDDISGLPCFNNGQVTVSVWQLDPEEIDEIVRTGRIYLSVMMGKSMPPVYLGGEEATRMMVQDYGGVWKR